MKYSRVICVFSGGGAKAAAHVGALRALHEWKLVPSHFVGTSFGAVVAACFASGLSYDEVLKRVAGLTRRDVASPSLSMLLGPFAKHLLRGEPLIDTIARLVPAREFEDLVVPLTVTAVDSANGELVLFGAGGRSHIPLIDALYASSALPLYYPPAQIGDRLFVDGGLRAVLPLDIAADFEPDLMFAVSVGPSFYSEPSGDSGRIPPMIRSHDRAMRILMAAQTEEVIARWKDGPIPLILVQPHMQQRSTFQVSSAIHYIEEGYRAANRALSDWLSSTSP